MRKGNFDSGYEQEIFKKLQRAKVDVKYEPRSFKYSRRTSKVFCRDCGSNRIAKSASYTPDFRIGRSIYLESKGYFKPSNRARMEDFIKDRPDVDLRFIFGSDNWLTAKKISRYSDWAEKNKVKYAIDEIPASWLKDARKELASEPDTDRGEPLQAVRDPAK